MSTSGGPHVVATDRFSDLLWMPHGQHKISLFSDTAYNGVDVRHHRQHGIRYHELCEPFLCSLGLYQVSRMENINIDKWLLAGLVERWRPETHTFHLPVGEMTVTLQDVSCLWGLPIKGDPVTGFADCNAYNLVEQLLGNGAADAVLKKKKRPGSGETVVLTTSGYSIGLKELRIRFAAMPNEPTAEQVHQYTRAYILDLFGSILFADSSGDSVPVAYLQFLDNLDQPRQYNWGGAVLALLYRNLCIGAERKPRTMWGPTLLLQHWCWSRLPTGRPRLKHGWAPKWGDPDLLKCPAIGEMWCHHHVYNQAHNRAGVSYFRNQLQDLEDYMIKWEPYRDMLNEVPSKLPTRVHDESDVWLAGVPLIHFWIVEHHYPNRVMRQFGLAQVIPPALPLHEAEVKFPKIIRNSSCSTLWHKSDKTYLVPKAYVVIDFHCPLASYSPEAEVLTSLFVALLMDYLNDYAYNAQIASLYYGIHATTTGFQVVVTGYNHKMRLLVDAIMMQIAHFEVKPKRFAVFKETLLKDFENFKFSRPCSQAGYYLNLMLDDRSWPLNENLEALSDLNADHLSNFVPNLLSRTLLECFVAGNIEEKEAESIVTDIEEILFKTPNSVFKPLLPSQYLSTRAVMLESGLKCLYLTEGLNPKDENSAIVQYIQIHHDDAYLNVQLQLFSLIASQPAFHQLRSVEQLGYITSLSSRHDAGVRGLEVVIQSTVKDPDILDGRIDAFFASLEKKIYELDDEEYKKNVKTLIDLKLEKFKNLWEESGYYWGEIISGTHKFDRFESEVEVLRALKKEDFINYFNQYIKVDAPKRKTLSVQVFGSNHISEYKKVCEEPDPLQTYRIEDIFSYRRTRPLFGSLRGGPCQAVKTKCV